MPKKRIFLVGMGNRNVGLRHYKILPINFKAKSYTELIDFDSIQSKFITEPPLLFDYSEDQLRACTEGVDLPDFPDLPAHSQNVERAVAATTEAAANAIGLEDMHALILRIRKARDELPKDAKKSNFLES